jgi:hypothetical protein
MQCYVKITQYCGYGEKIKLKIKIKISRKLNKKSKRKIVERIEIEKRKCWYLFCNTNCNTMQYGVLHVSGVCVVCGVYIGVCGVCVWTC